MTHSEHFLAAPMPRPHNYCCTCLQPLCDCSAVKRIHRASSCYVLVWQVDLKLQSDTIDLSTYSGAHRMWSLVSTKAQRNELKFEFFPESFVDATFSLRFKRQGSRTTHLFDVASVVIALILPVIFILPPESSEKINYGKRLHRLCAK